MSVLCTGGDGGLSPLHHHRHRRTTTQAPGFCGGRVRAPKSFGVLEQLEKGNKLLDGEQQIRFNNVDGFGERFYGILVGGSMNYDYFATLFLLAVILLLPSNRLYSVAGLVFWCAM